MMAESFKNFKGNLMDSLAYQIPGNLGLSQEEIQTAVNFLSELDDTDFEGISYNRDIATVQTSESYLTDNTYYKGLFFITRNEFLSRFNINSWRPVHLPGSDYLNKASFENNYPEDSIFFVYQYKDNGTTVNEPNNNYTYVEVNNKLSTVNNYNRFIKVWHNGLSKYLYIPFPENGRFTYGGIAFTSAVTGLDFTFYCTIYPYYSYMYGYTETVEEIMASENVPQNIVSFYGYRKQEFDEILRNYQIEKVYISQEEVTNNTPSYITSDRPEPEPEDPGSEPSGNPIKTEQGQEQNKINNEGGTGDRTSDNIQNLIPTNVIGTAGVGTGCYAMNWKQVLKVMGEIWNTSFWETISSLTLDPASTIISLQLYPIDFSNYAGVIPKNENSVYLGNYEIKFKAETEGTVSQISAINTIKAVITENFKLENISGSFLDYEPYTKMRIYLPYVGEQEISAQHVFGKTLKIYYNIDVTTGMTKAIIEVNGTPLYSWKADIAVDIPITSSNFGEIKTKAALGSISAAIKAGTGMITGGSTITSQGISEGISTVKDTIGAMKYSTSGSTGTSLERMDPQGCYLIIEYVETAVPDGYSHIKGRPSLLTTKLENLKGEGFTQIDVSHFEISGATESEKNEIENIFKEGVIIK